MAPSSVSSIRSHVERARAASTSSCVGRPPPAPAFRHNSISGRQVTSNAPSVATAASLAARSTATVSRESATFSLAAAAFKWPTSESSSHALIRASTVRSTSSASSRAASARARSCGWTTATSAQVVPITPCGSRTTAIRPPSPSRAVSVCQRPTATSATSAAISPPPISLRLRIGPRLPQSVPCLTTRLHRYHVVRGSRSHLRKPLKAPGRP